jgi:hypothetical protein
MDRKAGGNVAAHLSRLLVFVEGAMRPRRDDYPYLRRRDSPPFEKVQDRGQQQGGGGRSREIIHDNACRAQAVT